MKLKQLRTFHAIKVGERELSNFHESEYEIFLDETSNFGKITIRSLKDPSKNIPWTTVNNVISAIDDLPNVEARKSPLVEKTKKQKA